MGTILCTGCANGKSFCNISMFLWSNPFITRSVNSNMAIRDRDPPLFQMPKHIESESVNLIFDWVLGIFVKIMHDEWLPMSDYWYLTIDDWWLIDDLDCCWCWCWADELMLILMMIIMLMLMVLLSRWANEHMSRRYDADADADAMTPSINTSSTVVQRTIVPQTVISWYLFAKF